MKALLSLGMRVLALSLALFGMLSCTRDQQLVAITIEPNTETFGASNIPVSADAGLSVQLRALGHYIHPPVTKDVTNEVMWGSNDIQMVTVNPTGLIMVTGGSCGGTLISATINTDSSAGNRPSESAIVTGTMMANVVCFTGTGAGPLLAVNIASGTGTIASSPPGISCPSTCNANFASGTTVTLTATPTAPATSVSWNSGCSSTSGNTCTVNLIADDVVTASFF
jgi:hypothetical protein